MTGGMESFRLVLEVDSIEEAQLLSDLAMYGITKVLPMPTQEGTAWATAKMDEKAAAIARADHDVVMRLAARMEVFMARIAQLRVRRN